MHPKIKTSSGHIRFRGVFNVQIILQFIAYQEICCVYMFSWFPWIRSEINPRGILILHIVKDKVDVSNLHQGQLPCTSGRNHLSIHSLSHALTWQKSRKPCSPVSYLQSKLLMFYYDINSRQKCRVFGHLITLHGINSHLELFIMGRKKSRIECKFQCISAKSPYAMWQEKARFMCIYLFKKKNRSKLSHVL